MSDMDAHFQTYEEAKGFLDWTPQDDANLQDLGPVFDKHGPGITDRFYEALGKYEKTARIIEGRVDALKKTHKAWMGLLFKGAYGREYFDVQYRIGQVHVTQNINPEFVESVMSVIRAEGRFAINEEIGHTERAGELYDSLLKVLDVTLLVINLAYADERIDRMVLVTGMSRKLIENLIKRGGKKKGV